MACSCGRQCQGRQCQQCARDEYWEKVSAGEIAHPLEEQEDDR